MKVVATIQSTINPEEPPVDMQWYLGNDPVAVMVAVGQQLTEASKDFKYSKTLSIRIDL